VNHGSRYVQVANLCRRGVSPNEPACHPAAPAPAPVIQIDDIQRALYVATSPVEIIEILAKPLYAPSRVNTDQ
jgi:hypothetical protein